MKNLIGFLLVFCSLSVHAQTLNYEIFDNYKLSAEANSVRFIIQDNQGVIWAGTDKGLHSFDGYTAYPHYTPGEKSNGVVHCGLFINDNQLILGTEFGMLLYNISTDQYDPFLPEFNHDIRAIIKIDNLVWIGCFDGLFTYNLDSGELNELYANEQKGTKHSMIYALLENNAYVYLGTNNQFGRISTVNKNYEVIKPSTIGGNFLVSSLLKDQKRNCIWVGQGGRLLKFFPETKKIKYVENFDVVKSMALDAKQNLVIGTDNGLSVFDGNEKRIIVHDTREKKSLADNVVWSVYRDSFDNMWLGTNNGISLLPKHRRFNILPIYNITGTGEGNQITSIHRDSYNNYWMGGSNGLIMCEGAIDKNTDVRWYKMGETKNHLSHNHVRDIFEDKDKNLWIATDFGLNLFNRESKRFKRILINAKDGSQNAAWAYDILEDNQNRLWVASNNGGVFIVDKKKLNTNHNFIYADFHYSSANGLSGNNVDIIVADQKENVWALIHNIGIDIINTQTGKVSKFPIQDYTEGIIPNTLMTDKEGFIWVGFANGIAKINPSSKAVNSIILKGTGHIEVLEMIDMDKTIWVSTSNGIRIVDKKELSVQHLNYVNNVFSSMYYDASNNKVIMGGLDVIAFSEPNTSYFQKADNIIISAIYVNNQLYTKQKNPQSPRYLEEIKLKHNQNNIEIEFSDLTYTEENKGSFIYKINEEEKWTALLSGENKIQLNKLSAGTYHLSIGRVSGRNNTANPIKQFTIVVTPPWYASPLALIIYTLMLISFAWWIYYFITAKNRMKYEKLEKEKTLEQSKLKISFFSDVAHEFKTPLSLIIAPLTGLIRSAKNEKDRNALEMIHQNAMKLNSLIHQAIDYYRDDSKVNIGLLLSKVELVEFARSIFSSYKEGMMDKEIEFIFNTNVDHVYINIDILKVESVFNNLLSNACKFTNSRDSIIFSIEYNEQDEHVEIRISDTGTGISKQDLPYIFQRFYQSNTNSKKHQGKGIGLFLVKNYIELHGGEVNAISEPDEGTTFSIQLPAMNLALEEQQKEPKSNETKPEKQLIVVVEDNAAIAEFIYNTFISNYRCVVANNGKVGLKACIDLKPDLIIADIMMPVMDGFEMAKRLKNNALTATIPLVFLTAKDDKETELKSIELNIDAFIAKPFDSSILYSRVNQILENRRLLEKKARIENIATPKFEKVESQDEKFLSKITKIIEDKIAEPDLNVNMLCDLADINSKQLYRKIKQLTGLTTIDFIKSIRMKKAAMYLSNNNFSIAEIMYMVGFTNHSYFAKCFQSKFGMTPRQYIEQMNGNEKK